MSSKKAMYGLTIRRRAIWGHKAAVGEDGTSHGNKGIATPVILSYFGMAGGGWKLYIKQGVAEWAGQGKGRALGVHAAWP